MNFLFQKENEDKSPTAQIQSGTSTTSNELHQMHEQLEQQTLQTRQALSQLMLVREQLITETNARIEAQVIISS